MVVVDKRCARSPHEAIAWWGKRPACLWIARGRSLNAPCLQPDRRGTAVHNSDHHLAHFHRQATRWSVQFGSWPWSPVRLAPPAQQLTTSTDFTFCIPIKQPSDQTTLSAMHMPDHISTLIPSSHASCSSCQHGSQGLLTASSSPSPWQTGNRQQASACGFQHKLALVADALLVASRIGQPVGNLVHQCPRMTERGLLRLRHAFLSPDLLRPELGRPTLLDSPKSRDAKMDGLSLRSTCGPRWEETTSHSPIALQKFGLRGALGLLLCLLEV